MVFLLMRTPKLFKMLSNNVNASLSALKLSRQQQLINSPELTVTYIALTAIE